MVETKDLLEIIISVLTVITLAWGLFYAVRSFGLKREKFSFLTMNLDANVLKQVGDLLLVSIIVQLENKGQTRISARRYQDTIKKEGDLLYSEKGEECKYAGTLKIRSVSDEDKTARFDWYSLQPITSVSVIKDGKEHAGDLEQINYLNEYEDPETRYKDVDFWLEPNETYNCQVMAWLQPGTYAMKAYFFGELAKYREDEYWSTTRLFDLRASTETIEQGKPHEN